MPQQGIWNLAQQSQALTNNQWTKDPNFDKTVLLLQADGTGNGSGNNDFRDEGPRNFYPTRLGNAHQGSFSPFSLPEGYWSNYQSAVDTSYISFTTSAGTLFQFPGDFTIEAWVCLTKAASGDSIWVTNDGSSNYFAINHLSANFDIYLNSSSSTNTIPHGLVVNQWSHVAMVRSGSTITVYTNGVAKGTLTNSSTLGYANPSIARNGGGGANSRYMSNLRIVKGTALYTANFTPPTAPLTNIPNTSLLTCQSNRFVDNSSNALVATVTGTPFVKALSPFTSPTTVDYTPVFNPDGFYSTYFKGSPDYLSLTPTTALDFGSGNFTIECWANFNSTSGTQVIQDFGFGAGPSLCYVFYYSGSTINFDWSTNGSSGNGPNSLGSFTPVVGTWYHIAVVRNGDVFTCYVNGSALNAPKTQSGTIYYNASSNWRIGVNATDFFKGSISNFRIIKGTALYTGTFTPPTQPLTAVSGTSLLTCRTNDYSDWSSNGFAITQNGSPNPSNFNPFTLPSTFRNTNLTGGSAHFDGDDAIRFGTTYNTQFDGGTTWSAEAWFYSLATDSGKVILAGNWSYINGGWDIIQGSNVVSFRWCNGSYYDTGGAAIVKNAWYHVAVSISGGRLSFYVNGVRTYTTTSNTNIGAGTDRAPYIGYNGGDGYFTGYITGVRITNGSTPYDPTLTTIPVPTEPIKIVDGTVLLMNFNEAGIHDSTKQTNWESKALRGGTYVDTTIKKNGTGSFYFDGTQAYAATERLLPAENYPSLIFGTGDFTIESWLYCIGKPVNSGISGIWDQRPGVNGTYINWVVDFGSYGGAAITPTLVLYADSATRLRSDYIPIGRWFHSVLCRKGGVTRIYIDGKLACTPLADTRDYAGGGSAANFRPVIGQSDGGDAFYGYMDDFRASRFCRYNNDFIPPKQAFPRQ